MNCPHCQASDQSPGTKCTRCGRDIPALDPQGPELDTDLDAKPILPKGEYLSPEDIFADRYEVVRELGRGGMGVVYLVRDQVLGSKEFALKAITSELLAHPQTRDRFVREVLAAQTLTHNNIVKVFHLDEHQGQIFFIMEYVPGQSLRELLESRRERDKVFSLDEVFLVIQPCLSALSHAHSHNVVHRDLKPDNIMVAGDFPDIQVKVLDFGLAKILSSYQITSSALSMGTAYYMSPEQLKGARDVDARSDIYSAGVVLYELLTGEVPQGRFPLPSEIMPGIPRVIDEVIDKVLKPKPGDRFQNIDDMSTGLDKAFQIQKEEEFFWQQEGQERLQKERQEQETQYREEAERLKKEKEAEELRRNQKEQNRLKKEKEKQERKERQKRKRISVLKWEAENFVEQGDWFGAIERLECVLTLQPGDRQVKKRLKEIKVKASEPQPGEVWTDPVTSMEFVWIPGGCFQMGSHDGYYDEKPVHEVCVDGFWMGRYPVIQGQWKKVMKNNPAYLEGDDHPVEQVSWNDAQEFILELNSRSDGEVIFRLPTEAEWEYACRSGGKNEKYSGGDDVNSVAWYGSNSGDKTHVVGTKAPNSLGLYDMCGNVWEWCEDVYREDAYSKHQRDNPICRGGGCRRVYRGGSWYYYPRRVRCTNRSWYNLDYRSFNVGFRLVRTK